MGTERHDAALDEASFAKATQRGRRILSSGPVAKMARYETGRIHVELNNGCAFAFPVEQTQGLAGAKVSDLRKIEVTAAGLGLYWPTLDVDLFVPTLVKAVLGTKLWMADLGKIGGTARSDIKAAAARVNGKLGGRPRKPGALEPA